MRTFLFKHKSKGNQIGIQATSLEEAEKKLALKVPDPHMYELSAAQG